MDDLVPQAECGQCSFCVPWHCIGLRSHHANNGVSRVLCVTFGLNQATNYENCELWWRFGIQAERARYQRAAWMQRRCGKSNGKRQSVLRAGNCHTVKRDRLVCHEKNVRPLTSQRTLKTIEVQSGKTAGDAPVLRHLHIYLVTRQTLIQLREAEEMTGKSILLGIYTWNSIQGAMVHHASPFQKQSVHRRLSDCAILRIEGFEFSLVSLCFIAMKSFSSRCLCGACLIHVRLKRGDSISGRRSISWRSISGHVAFLQISGTASIWIVFCLNTSIGRSVRSDLFDFLLHLLRLSYALCCYQHFFAGCRCKGDARRVLHQTDLRQNKFHFEV